MDEWARALTDRFVATATEGYESYLTVNVLRAFEQYVDDLSNWYIRRSRRRFWNGDEAALRTLWVSLVQSLRAVSPVLPFLTEHLWQHLVARRVPRCAALGLPRRLAGARRRPTTSCSTTSPRCARSSSSAAAPASRRQAAAAPAARHARRRRLRPRVARHVDEIAEELRVKQRRLRADRGDRDQRATEPQDARPAPRRRRQQGAPGAGRRRLRDAARRQLRRRRLHDRRRRTSSSSGPRRRGGPSRRARTTRSRWRSTPRSPTTCAARAGSTTSSTTSTACARTAASRSATASTSTLPAADADLLAFADWIKAETLAVSLDDAGDAIRLERV